ncbi:MAG: hypothetical protein MI746_07745, partial [Pseudomonadales bacterium]|nr:hypothetical protein [Pseudomonadales bacterium]
MHLQLNSTRSFFLVAGLLFVATLASYGGNGSHELLQWDDVAYVSSNDWVTNPSWQGLIALFTEYRVFNWHPITWLSYIPEYALCGDNAACYKATNIVLHSINALLVFVLCGAILRLITIKSDHVEPSDNHLVFVTSFTAALLFAVHPQHTESVIWVAERKDLLCAAFYLAALITYLRHYAAERI